MANNVPANRNGLPHPIFGRNPNPNYYTGQTGTTGARVLRAVPMIARFLAPSSQPPTAVLPVNRTAEAAQPVRSDRVVGGGVSDIRRLVLGPRRGLPAGVVPGQLTSVPVAGAGGGGAGAGGVTGSTAGGTSLTDSILRSGGPRVGVVI